MVTSSEKSQHQNRANAMAALKSRLYEMELRRRNEAMTAQHEAKGDAGWGNESATTSCSRIRWSRTCAPTSRPRTPPASSMATSTPFMAAALALQVTGKSRAEAQAEG